MNQRLLTAVRVLFTLALPASLSAQPVPWTEDVEQGMGDAKKHQLPVMFFLDTAPEDAEEEGREQGESLASPQVGRATKDRFVPIRLAKSSTTEMLLQQMKAKEATPFSIVVATPGGRLLDTIAAGDVAKPDVLADQLTATFRAYRKSLFEDTLKSVLEDKSAKTSALINTLRLIERLVIVESDSTVVELFDREDLSGDVKTRMYRTLAVLSTPRTVKALFAAARDNEDAVEALLKCTPAAAELLLPELDSKKPKEQALAYDAVTKICAVGDAKPQLFHEDASKDDRRAEIERVKSAVTEAAKRWSDGFGRYR